MNNQIAVRLASGEMMNAFDESRLDVLPEDAQRIIKRRKELLGPAYRLQYERPLRFVRGDGVFLYDDEGVEYLDAYNNVPSVGHCHPRVAGAVSEQLTRLNTNTRYMDEALLDYAERLLATHDENLDKVMFTCSASEANDLALRIARHHTGGTGIIISKSAYHGTTAALAEISPTLGPAVPLGAHVRTVELPFGLEGESAVAFLLRNVQDAIADLERHGFALCAFVADTLFTSDGILAEPKGMLAPVAEAVRAAGGLFIADEVQPGFARTGEAMWGYQRHGISPDIAVMGKPMGNGYPVAGLVARSEVATDFGLASRYFNTFGGSSASIAAAAATLSVIEDEGLLNHTREVGALVRSALESVFAEVPYAGEIRGAGLYWGVDLVDPISGAPRGDLAAFVVNAMRERKVLISATGSAGQTLKIRPPLVFTAAHLDRFVEALKSSLDALAGSVPQWIPSTDARTGVSILN